MKAAVSVSGTLMAVKVHGSAFPGSELLWQCVTLTEGVPWQCVPGGECPWTVSLAVIDAGNMLLALNIPTLVWQSLTVSHRLCHF